LWLLSSFACLNEMAPACMRLRCVALLSSLSSGASPPTHARPRPHALALRRSLARSPPGLWLACLLANKSVAEKSNKNQHTGDAPKSNAGEAAAARRTRARDGPGAGGEGAGAGSAAAVRSLYARSGSAGALGEKAARAARQGGRGSAAHRTRVPREAARAPAPARCVHAMRACGRVRGGVRACVRACVRALF
jgi:hypothetical protein